MLKYYPCASNKVDKCDKKYVREVNLMLFLAQNIHQHHYEFRFASR